MHRLRNTIIGAILAVAPIFVGGQESPGVRRVVVVRIVGPDSVAVPGVNVAISRSDVGAILVGRTDANGTHTFSLRVQSADYTVLARRPGFSQSDVRLTFASADTIRVVLMLSPADPTELARVRIEARPSNYILSSEQIAASRRPIRDAFEALRKLRPYMLYDKDRCKGEVVENVWINGERVLFMASNAIVLPPATLAERRSRRAPRQPVAVDSVLASVRAEHLLEIRLVNCWDTSLPGVGAKNALYVALRPGIDWDWKRGSFVADSNAYNRRP
jgi:hypothetical protein